MNSNILRGIPALFLILIIISGCIGERKSIVKFSPSELEVNPDPINIKLREPEGKVLEYIYVDSPKDEKKVQITFRNNGKQTIKINGGVKPRGVDPIDPRYVQFQRSEEFSQMITLTPGDTYTTWLTASAYPGVRAGSHQAEFVINIFDTSDPLANLEKVVPISVDVSSKES